MLIKNGKIITADGNSYENGYIYIVDTKIAGVGDMNNLPEISADEEVIDASGHVIMPGFIDAHCHLGMWEDSLGFEGADGNEMTNPVTPHLRAIDAINPMDRCFDEALTAGVTTVITGPGSANVIGGQMAAVKTYGNRIDDMLIDGSIAMKMAFGENPKRIYNAKDKTPMTRMGSASLIREALYKAKVYMEKKETAAKTADLSKLPEYDMACEALIPVLQRKQKAHIHAHRADDIFSAIRIAKEFNLDFVMVHCTEGHLIANQLKEENVNAIIGPVMTDRSKPELRNSTAKNASVLEEASVYFAICTDHPVIPIQYLNISAGVSVSEGLPFMSAIEALTIRPAKICGIDHLVGSITVGKDADILMFKQDPLSAYGKPSKVIINGVKVKG